MNVSGSKTDVWRAPTTIKTPPLSESQPSTSPLGFFKAPPLPLWNNAPLDLPAPVTSQDFLRFPFPSPDLCNIGFTSSATNAVTRFLLAQIGAAALSSLADTPTTTSAPTSTGIHNVGRNLFSIADHISDDVKDGEEEVKDNSFKGNDGASLCCPICHEDLESKDLSAHISHELKALEEDTQKWQNSRPEQSMYERCISLPSGDFYDHISSSQRYYKFQLIKQRRLARKMNFPINRMQEDYTRGCHQPLKMTSSFLGPPLMPNLSAKIRRIDKH